MKAERAADRIFCLVSFLLIINYTTFCMMMANSYKFYARQFVNDKKGQTARGLSFVCLQNGLFDQGDDFAFLDFLALGCGNGDNLSGYGRKYFFDAVEGLNVAADLSFYELCADCRSS